MRSLPAYLVEIRETARARGDFGTVALVDLVADGGEKGRRALDQLSMLGAV